jgi:hypothetical protein
MIVSQNYHYAAPKIIAKTALRCLQRCAASLETSQCNLSRYGVVFVERVVVVVWAGISSGTAGAVVLSDVVVVLGGGAPPQPVSRVMPPIRAALASSRMPDL